MVGDMTERDLTLEPFDALIGTWTTEATHPLVDDVVPGSITFEGQWQLAKTPGDWQDDLKVIYRRRD